MSSPKIYQIIFGIENEAGGNDQIQQYKEEIPDTNVKILGSFNFTDYKSTIESVKEFFLTTFGYKFKFCRCVLFLYEKEKHHFSPSIYRLLSRNDNKKISESKHSELYLIKTNSLCDCEYKMYLKYMNMNKFDIITKLKQLDAINQENEKRIKELEEKSKEHEKIKEENKISDKNAKFEEKYDISFRINSIKCLNKFGWEILFDENGLKKYEENKDKEIITIGVLGNSNKGKSFILSRITNITFYSGTSIQTLGLCVKYPDLKEYKGRQLILLDTAGLETPVLKRDNYKEEKKENKDKNEIQKIEDKDENNNILEIKEKENKLKENPDNQEIKEEKELKENTNSKEIEQNKEFKENARDKIMTELFLENFIIEASDILLIVVGKLTYSEQLMINKVKLERIKQPKSKFFIIHNLQEFRDSRQVEEYIKTTLTKCSTFNLKKRTLITTKKSKEIIDNDIIEEIKEIDDEIVEEESKLKDIHFTEILNGDDGKKLEIYHLIIANEYSEAGKVYNHYAYNFIETVYNFIIEPKKFDVIEQVKENFYKQSKNILKDEIKKEDFNTNEQILKEKVIKLNLKKELTLKKCYRDEVGLAFFKTGDFEPKYNFFKPNENTLEIRVEAPGNSYCDDINHTIEGEETIISIKGNKKLDKFPAKIEDNIYNSREFSTFELNIPLKIENYRINQKTTKQEPVFINGVWCIQYELAQKGEKVIAKPKQML